MVNRTLRDDPSKGDMHNRQALSFTMIWECLGDFHMWPVYLIGLSWLLPANPATAYLTLNLRSLGFSTFETSLLTIPAYVVFICNLLFWTWLSEKINERFLLATVSQLWVIPLLIALETLPADRNPWVAWVLAVLIVGQPYFHAVLVVSFAIQSPLHILESQLTYPPSVNHISKRRLSPHTDSCHGTVQYGRAGLECYRL